MLGWGIGVYRQKNDGITPATFESPVGNSLATWETGLGGLDWINELIKNGSVKDLGGNGYPIRYTATANNILPIIIGVPPLARARETLPLDEGDILLKNWKDETALVKPEIVKCNLSEWLIIEAFDLS